MGSDKWILVCEQQCNHCSYKIPPKKIKLMRIRCTDNNYAGVNLKKYESYNALKCDKGMYLVLFDNGTFYACTPDLFEEVDFRTMKKVWTGITGGKVTLTEVGELFQNKIQQFIAASNLYTKYNSSYCCDYEHCHYIIFDPKISKYKPGIPVLTARLMLDGNIIVYKTDRADEFLSKKK